MKRKLFFDDGKKKKQKFIVALAIVLICTVSVLACISFLKSRENGTIIIRGKGITSISIDWDSTHNNMRLPFVAVLQELGYHINQEEENVILIYDGSQYFELNLEEETMYKVGGTGLDLNYLASPPGSTGGWRSRKGNDIILAPTSFNDCLRLMDSDYRIAEFPGLKTVLFY